MTDFQVPIASDTPRETGKYPFIICERPPLTFSLCKRIGLLPYSQKDVSLPFVTVLKSSGVQVICAIFLPYDSSHPQL